MQKQNQIRILADENEVPFLYLSTREIYSIKEKLDKIKEDILLFPRVIFYINGVEKLSDFPKKSLHFIIFNLSEFIQEIKSLNVLTLVSCTSFQVLIPELQKLIDHTIQFQLPNEEQRLNSKKLNKIK